MRGRNSFFAALFVPLSVDRTFGPTCDCFLQLAPVPGIRAAWAERVRPSSLLSFQTRLQARAQSSVRNVSSLARIGAAYSLDPLDDDLSRLWVALNE